MANTRSQIICDKVINIGKIGMLSIWFRCPSKTAPIGDSYDKLRQVWTWNPTRIRHSQLFKMADDQGVEVKLHAYLKNLGTKSQNGDDCSFMEIIKEFPSIYNRSSAQFKDKNIKSNAWKEIASLHTDMDVNTCKQRYESIRTTFSRYLKRCKPPSGSGSDSVILRPNTNICAGCVPSSNHDRLVQILSYLKSHSKFLVQVWILVEKKTRRKQFVFQNLNLPLKYSKGVMSCKQHLTIVFFIF